MKTSVFEALNILKIGNNILTEFNKEMNNHNWTYEDFKEMQNNYEKLLREFCIVSYGFGKLGKSEEEFIKWVNEISAYEDNTENTKSELNSQQNKIDGVGSSYGSSSSYVPTSRTKQRETGSADTQNLNNTSTNLNLNKGCGKEIDYMTGEGIIQRWEFCGQNGVLCDKCKKLKAIIKDFQKENSKQ